MIYLDNNSTTKPFPDVIKIMTEFMISRFWNVSSAYGQLDKLEEVIESSQMAIRKLCGLSQDDKVVFTSGATESNNWAVIEGCRRTVKKGWVLSSQMEHPSVREVLEHYQKRGTDVRWLPVNRDGTIDLNKLSEIANPDLCFATFMLAHNETGVIQPLKKAITIIREQSPDCLIHTDGTQAFGKVPISFSRDLDEIDLISFSGHKFHGPKGIGGLIIRNGTKIQPLFQGGGQQFNLRSGTLNLPAIAGISVAANQCCEFLQEKKQESVQTIRDFFEESLCSNFPKSIILGRQATRLPNTSFFGISGTDADDLLYALLTKKIVINKGSACSAQSIKPSKIALLMGYSYEESSSLIRFSASQDTAINDVQFLVNSLRELCPF